MATAQKHLTGINLLPQEEFTASTFGRIITWLLSTFRIIVIFTEVIVMAVFLSRFWLDVKANDLNELLRKNQAILGTTTDFENEFRDIQKKLDTFEKVSELKIYSSEYINRVSNNLPQDVYLTSISIADNSIQMKGNSASEIAISQFLVNLKNDFLNTTLMGTNTDQQNISLIEFSVKIDMSQKGEK
ncbi:MAG: PilN domain-containing protein [Patescibacteria group bacterium]